MNATEPSFRIKSTNEAPVLKHVGPKMKMKVNKGVKPRSVTFPFSHCAAMIYSYHDIQIHCGAGVGE